MEFVWNRPLVVNVRDILIDTFNFTTNQEDGIVEAIKPTLTKDEVEYILDGGQVDKVVKEITFTVGQFGKTQNFDVMTSYITLDIIIYEKEEKVLDKLPKVWYN